MRLLNFGADKSGLHSYCLPAPDTVNAVSLSASVAESITIPSGAKYVIFSATADFYANYSTTATVPGDTTDGSASELNPTGRRLTGEGMNPAVTAISVISADTCIITASFYA